MVPVPRGAGIVAARVPKKVLQFAGINDAFTSSHGSTKILGNFVKSSPISLNGIPIANPEKATVKNTLLRRSVPAPTIILAVFADPNKIKILANDVGNHMLQSSSYLPCDIHLDLSRSSKKGETLEPRAPVKLNGVLGSQKHSTILDVSRCRSLKLPSVLKTSKICRLTYANSRNGIVALAADGSHLVWRWPGLEL